MKTAAVIPIDNRSVCYDLIKQTAEVDSQYKILMPPLNLLGDLKHNANTKKLLNWIASLKNVDFIILALDTIAYGGLISSRKSSESFEVIKSRIDLLIEILKKLDSKVYAFSSIMRISNNNINEEEKEYWALYGKKIFEYSYNFAKTGKEDTTCGIPSEILEDYLNTRKRNFEINQYYIELKKQGIFETLVFSKDDCAQYGINVQEAEKLKEISKNIKEIFIKTGADEIPLTLLSRALNSSKNIKIAPLYINSESINKISKYEDISVKTSVESQIELAGAKIAEIDNCDLVLIVNNFIEEQGELVLAEPASLFESSLILPDKPYFIADIVNANGSDNNFVKKLLEQKTLKNFLGYAAWNTTGNTLGSALSCAMTYFKAQNPNKEAFYNLQLIRFLDDWAYQANVRQEIRNDSKNLSSKVIKSKMKKFEEILFNKHFKQIKIIEYSFPWNRFFEIRISIL